MDSIGEGSYKARRLLRSHSKANLDHLAGVVPAVATYKETEGPESYLMASELVMPHPVGLACTAHGAERTRSVGDHG